LTKSLWDSAYVQNEIRKIITDIERSLLPEACWPTHPLDAESYPKEGPKWAAYAGAAGTVHALQILKRFGYKAKDLSNLLPIIHSSYLQTPDVSVEPGLQMGELGILVPALLATPENSELSHCLKQCMEATLELPFYEITSGQSGMMHAALALYRKTADSQWKGLFIKGAESLMANWQLDSKSGEWLWRSQVFGMSRHYYGACHGVTGNANILLQGADLLPKAWQDIAIERTLTTLSISAKTQKSTKNWPICTKPNIEKLLVQWCHGAAGIVTAMARTPKSDSEKSQLLELLLLETSELVWQAGPLIKGAGICHGTAGNGYAFLYYYQRSGDTVWLERARKFAMHAIKQSQAARLSYGQGRYTLWTGDAGLAIYLHHCIFPEKASLPGLDLF